LGLELKKDKQKLSDIIKNQPIRVLLMKHIVINIVEKDEGLAFIYYQKLVDIGDFVLEVATSSA